MKKILTLLLVLGLLAGCSKEDGPAPDLTGEQTLILYFPYSGLAGNIINNLDELHEVWNGKIPRGYRILVYLSTYDKEHADLFDLTQWDQAQNKPTQSIKTYADPDFKTADGIAQVLIDAKTEAPAKRYAMVIGCHGMGWIPAPVQQGKGVLRQSQAAPQYKLHWDYTDENGNPLARYFGSGGVNYSLTHTDVTTLADALAMAGMKMEYLLFDVCYMANIETVYALRQVADNLIASVSEIPAHGFPYKQMGHHLLGNPDYVAICQAFGDFYKNYPSRPHATISLTKSSELDALAAIVKQIYADKGNVAVSFDAMQHYDKADYPYYFGYKTYHMFYDLSDYIHRLCTNQVLLDAFDAQLKKAVPENCLQHTPRGIAGSYTFPITSYSGMTTSDLLDEETCRDITSTEWWQATH